VESPKQNAFPGAVNEGPAGFWDFHRVLFEAAPYGIVIQDGAGAILNANPAAERCLGLSLDQLQGRTSIDPRWKAVREDGSPFPGEFHPAMQSLRTGQPTEGVVMGVFNPRLEQTNWIEISAVPMSRPGESRPFQVFTMFADITRRKRAEEKLQELSVHS
jgi:PAS domain S-box-containing protein